MKNLTLYTIKAMLILAIFAGAFSANAQEMNTRINNPQAEEEFESLMPVNGTVETYMGDYELDHSIPTKESSEELYRQLDLHRATELYVWALPIVAMERLHQNYFEQFDGYKYNTLVTIESFNERRGYLTANETTDYALGNYNTRDAAVIVKIPKGAIVGMVLDMWQESPTDMGIWGPERGAGATHVIVGPNTPQEMIPEPHTIGDDYRIHHINTDRGSLLLRIIGDKSHVAETWQKCQVYNYGQEPEINVQSGNDIFAPTYQPRGMAFWTYVHTAIQNEPVQERDRLFMYWLKTLGIEKGKPFNPTAYQTEVLTEGSKTGELMAKNFVFNERLDGVLRQNEWRYVLGGAWGEGIKNDQSQKYYDIYDPRARYSYEAQMTSPAMTIPREGTSQGYIAKFKDENGIPLKGDQNYVIEVSGEVPCNMFWSFTIYDNQTRVLLDNRATGGDVTVDSFDPNVKVNEDGSFYIMMGPDAAPKGWESNYVRTLPERGWFVYLRAYGAEKAFYDDSYKLPTVNKVDSFDEYIK